MSRSPRAYVPMVGWKLTRWLLFYAAMLLVDAAVVVDVAEG